MLIKDGQEKSDEPADEGKSDEGSDDGSSIVQLMKHYANPKCVEAGGIRFFRNKRERPSDLCNCLRLKRKT